MNAFITGAGCATLTKMKCSTPASFAGCYRLLERHQIDRSELRPLPRRRVPSPHQVNNVEPAGTSSRYVAESSTLPATARHPAGSFDADFGRTTALTSPFPSPRPNGAVRWTRTLDYVHVQRNLTVQQLRHRAISLRRMRRRLHRGRVGPQALAHTAARSRIPSSPVKMMPLIRDLFG